MQHIHYAAEKGEVSTSPFLFLGYPGHTGTTTPAGFLQTPRELPS